MRGAIETRICKQCGEPYSRQASYFRNCARGSFCSTACAGRSQIGKPRGTLTRLETKMCGFCARSFHPRRSSRKFCGRKCARQWLDKSGGPNWRGGRMVTADGYAWVQTKDHPDGKLRRGYVAEHRYVMELRLGRRLRKDETVHHINGIKSDNRPENLQLRMGAHGPGVVLCCGDCGSSNVVHAPIAVSMTAAG